MEMRRRRWLRCGRELVDGRAPGRGTGARVRDGSARGRAVSWQTPSRWLSLSGLTPTRSGTAGPVAGVWRR